MTTASMSSLSRSLSAALEARDERLIRRRLPEIAPTPTPTIDFVSNDYLSLSTSPALRDAVLAALTAAPQILGSGGSRLLVPAPAHAALEARLSSLLNAESALLFNSGFDANVGFFSAVPQPGDVVLYDAHVHASVHDGMRISRLPRDALVPFAHNSIADLRRTLARLIRDRDGLKSGNASVFVAVESLYSMDGTFAPLLDIVVCLEEMLPLGNGHLVVDEAHATGLYGPKGRGLVAALGLEHRVLARLHTFGKALAASGAVLLTTELIRDYLLNYARSLIYTTTLTFASVVAINCSFDMLENGTTEVLSAHLLDLCTYLLDLLRPQLKKYPSALLRLPDHLANDVSPSTTFPPHHDPPKREPWHSEPDAHLSNTSPTKKASSALSISQQPRAQLQDQDRQPRTYLHLSKFPPPTPIIPILTPEPRSLSSFLMSYSPPPEPSTSSTPTPSPMSTSTPTSTSTQPTPTSSQTATPAKKQPSTSTSPLRTPLAIHTKPIFPPTVPPGTSRVRICLHAGHTRADIEMLVRGIVAWAEGRMREGMKAREGWVREVGEVGVGAWMEAKL